MKIAFQGEHGAFSEVAAKKYFGEEIETVPSYAFADVFAKVQTKKVQFGVVPIENSLYGSVFDSYDLLLKSNLKVVGELQLQINHHLLAKKNLKYSEIKKVYSHPQALGQCADFLKTLKNAEILPSYDTAGSALTLLKHSGEPIAIVASKEAAEVYQLKILQRNIQNNSENYTRFLIIAKQPALREFKIPKTSICFELKNMPGALFKGLSVFALREINLVKIESRPIPHKPFEYRFYADFFGDLRDVRIKNALKNLAEISLSIKVFGTYEKGDIYKS
ncbi:MAG: prephenate dehydratase [Ignavibacteriaceae bacterium]|jgi:prephenate dehydratase